jgi:hypothetical protein
MAFRTAIGDVIADTSDLADPEATTWGSHWFYHAFAEAFSITFGTFVSGGLARERAHVAVSLAGWASPFWWTACLALLAFLANYSPSDLVSSLSYQSLVVVIAAIAAPIVGYNIGPVTREISTEQPTGFAGIPRAHFLWLWVPVHFYAVAIIGPTMTYFGSQLMGLRWRDTPRGQAA